MLERLIAYHCGPALAGIKPANLAACYKDKIADIHLQVERLNAELNARDIYIEIMCECEKRVLLTVYRKKVMEKQLQNSRISEFLSSFGYPAGSSVKVCIDFLKNRLKENDFPHEIGVFLGYPLHDIDGFINHRDEGCLLVGEWRVYDDCEGAKKLFSRYKACRRALVKRLSGGQSLSQIFCAA